MAIIGIDLGTTNSCVSIMDGDKTKVIESHNTTNSFCLNTRAIHGIATNCNSDRIILSISLKDKYNDYNTIKQMYEQGDLL